MFERNKHLLGFLLFASVAQAMFLGVKLDGAPLTWGWVMSPLLATIAFIIIIMIGRWRDK